MARDGMDGRTVLSHPAGRLDSGRQHAMGLYGGILGLR